MQKVKVFRCPECTKKYNSLATWSNHITTHHPEVIPESWTPAQYFYYLQTGKSGNKCIICKKPTEWNEATGKYERFCRDPKCKEKYREIFKQRMINTHGKVTLLNDPEQQRKMLEAKKSHGEVQFPDGIRVGYNSTYEHDFLTMMSTFLKCNGTDIMGPSPHTYYYDYRNPNDKENEGKKFYIPDYYIPSLNLEIEIKQNTSTHPKILAIDKVKEAQKDEVMSKIPGVRYIKIVDKDYSGFFDLLYSLRESYPDKKDSPAMEGFGALMSDKPRDWAQTEEELVLFTRRLFEWKYGFLKNGQPTSDFGDDDIDFDKYYRSMSPSDFGRHKIGVCWDYVAYEYETLARKYKLASQAFFVKFGPKDQYDDVPSHTFVLIPGEKNYYIEASMKYATGLYEFDTISDVVSFILNCSGYDPKVNIFCCRYNPSNYYGLDPRTFDHRVVSENKPEKITYKKNPKVTLIGKSRIATEANDPLSGATSFLNSIHSLLSEASIPEVIATEGAGYSKDAKYPVFILLTKGHSPLSGIIMKATRDQFSHSSLAFDISLNPMYSFGTKKLGPPRDMGFVKTHPKDPAWDNSQPTPWWLYVTYVDMASIEKMKSRLNYFVENAEKFRYSFAGLPKVFLQLKSPKERKWFCSAFVAEIIGTGKTLKKDSTLYMPRDLKDIDDVEFVISGDDIATYDYRKAQQALDKIIQSSDNIDAEESIFTDKIFNKKKLITLYHGSHLKFTKIKPIGIDFGNSFQDMGWSAFYFDNQDMATKWAIFVSLRATWNKMSEKHPIRGISTSADTFDLFATELDLNWWCNYLKNHSISAYVYTVQIPNSEVGFGNDSTKNEYTVRKIIKPINTKEIKITPELLLANVLIISKEEIEAKRKNVRRGARGPLSMIYNRDFPYLKASNKESIDRLYTDLENGRLQPGMNLKKYINDNGISLEKVPFIKRLPTLEETLQPAEEATISPTKKGTFYKDRWHSILELGNKKYRERVEILVFDENNRVYVVETKDGYLLPGGSTEPDRTLEEQCVAELREETRIEVTNLEYHLTYFTNFDAKRKRENLRRDPDFPIKYDGECNRVFTAKYRTGYAKIIPSRDADPEMLYGRWMTYKEAKRILRPEHAGLLKEPPKVGLNSEPKPLGRSPIEPDIIYHGSNAPHSILTPHISTHGLSVVYGTKDYAFALAFAGKQWNDLQINQAYVNGRQVLTEIEKGAFDRIFNCPGYIHVCDGTKFEQVPNSKHEWMCGNSIKPIRIINVDNVLRALQENGVLLLKYPRLPKHIKDRDEYIRTREEVWKRTGMIGQEPATESVFFPTAIEIPGRKPFKDCHCIMIIPNDINDNMTDNIADITAIKNKCGKYKPRLIDVDELITEYFGGKGAVKNPHNGDSATELCKYLTKAKIKKNRVEFFQGLPIAIDMYLKDYSDRVLILNISPYAYGLLPYDAFRVDFGAVPRIGNEIHRAADNYHEGNVWYKMADLKLDGKGTFVKHPEKLTLYHVSSNLNLKTLDPRPTRTPMRAENVVISRSSAAPSVDKCFGAISPSFGQKYAIYKLILTKDTRVFKPNTKAVPDVEKSDEHWILDKVRVKKIDTATLFQFGKHMYTYGDDPDKVTINGVKYDLWTESSRPGVKPAIVFFKLAVKDQPTHIVAITKYNCDSGDQIYLRVEPEFKAIKAEISTAINNYVHESFN